MGTRVDLYNVFCRPAATLCAVASLPLAPTMSAPTGAVTAHERLLAAVSAADELPRGTTFQKVKGARDRLRAELSSVQRTDGDELVKSATACAHRLNQRLSRMRKLGMDAPADAPEPAPAEAPIKSEPAAPEPAPAQSWRPQTQFLSPGSAASSRSAGCRMPTMVGRSSTSA